MDERELVRAAKKGDDQALGELFQQSYPFLLKYLMKLTFSVDQAEELAQETFAKAIGKLPDFRGTSKFSTWLISIGTRLYIDLKRRQKREAEWFKQQSVRNLKWNVQSTNEVWDDVMEVLGMLPDELRIPVILKHYYGFSYTEIGKIMGMPEGTAKSRVHKGIDTIRKGMIEVEEGSELTNRAKQ